MHRRLVARRKTHFRTIAIIQSDQGTHYAEDGGHGTDLVAKSSVMLFHTADP